MTTRLLWIAVLFIVGSALFALGAVPFYAEGVGLEVTAATFFVGSLFFTSAALLQYRETAGGYLMWAPRDLGWLSCAVQLAGTLWFNWSTGNALRHNLAAATADERVWRPDALGSVAFLVASAIAWIDATRAETDGEPRSRDWWIGAVNMAGSVAFGVSAVAAFIVPSDDEVWHVELSNLGTFAGALCFLAGAVMLLPRRAPAV
jgi:hypothetical protein